MPHGSVLYVSTLFYAVCSKWRMLLVTLSLYLVTTTYQAKRA